MKIKVEIPLKSVTDESRFTRIVEVEISDEQMRAIAQKIAAQLYTSSGSEIAVKQERPND